MDFHLSPDADELRAEARRFIAAEFTQEIRDRVRETGVRHDEGFTKALAAKHWVVPNWPADEGGLGRPLLEVQALAEELQYADTPVYGVGTTRICAGIIREIGSDWLKEQVLPGVLAGETVIVQGWTEPECGSDVAAVRTRAVRDGGDWVINGSKMFTTNASVGDYALILARTDPTLPKHKGLTTFVVPLDSEGFEVSPVFTVSGERTNVTFYKDVRISDAWRLGEVNDGWNSMTLGLTLERTGAFGGDLNALRDNLETWAFDHEEPDPAVETCIGRLTAHGEIARLLGRRSAWVAQSGGRPGVEGSMAKLYDSEALTADAAAVVDALGPDGMRRTEDPRAPLDGLAEELMRHSLGTTIYAGTSEIQRGIIAERGLGLPRGR